MKVTRLQPTTLPPPPGARSVVDIALWDWLGKYVRLPIHKLLGGSCRRIQAYASTPRLSRAEAYVDFTSQLRAEGFTAIKFHAWCEPDRDLEMVRAVRRVHSEPCGGITAARKVMTIAEAAGCRCERQCWGYTLSQAANLQTMLGLPNCSFFEVGPIRFDVCGRDRRKRRAAEVREEATAEDHLKRLFGPGLPVASAVPVPGEGLEQQPPHLRQLMPVRHETMNLSSNVSRKFRLGLTQDGRPRIQFYDEQGICCFNYRRTVAHDNPIQLDGTLLQFHPGPGGRSYAGTRGRHSGSLERHAGALLPRAAAQPQAAAPWPPPNPAHPSGHCRHYRARENTRRHHPIIHGDEQRPPLHAAAEDPRSDIFTDPLG